MIQDLAKYFAWTLKIGLKISNIKKVFCLVIDFQEPRISKWINTNGLSQLGHTNFRGGMFPWKVADPAGGTQALLNAPYFEELGGLAYCPQHISSFQTSTGDSSNDIQVTCTSGKIFPYS